MYKVTNSISYKQSFSVSFFSEGFRLLGFEGDK